MKPSRLLLATALAIDLAGCGKPPPEVYVTTAQTATAAEAVAVGNNEVNEPCRYQTAPSDQFGVGGRSAVAIFCGTWEQPSGRIFELGGGAEPGHLRALATAGPWRSYVDQRFACGAPTETRILNGAPALLMQCTRRNGGWPHLAMTAALGGRVFAADGVRPALPAIEATMAALAGESVAGAAAPRSEAQRLIASRSAGQAFGSGDEGRYSELTRLGDAYNNVDDPAHAETAYREALAVQQHFLSPDNTGLALTMMKLAAQISHQRNAPEADRLLDNAATLTARAGNPLLAAQLDYYRAVTAAYEGKAAEALNQSAAAEERFTRLLPSAAGEAAPRPTVGAGPRSQGLMSRSDCRPHQGDHRSHGDRVGRDLARASLLRLAGNTAESSASPKGASAGKNGPPFSAPAVARLLASNEASAGNYSGADTYAHRLAVFERVVPGASPVAVNALQQGAYRLKQGNSEAALALFDKAGKILSRVATGASPELILPWLDALYAAGERTPADRPRLNAKMFEAAQLAQGSLTAQQIAQSAARLGAGDSKASAALRNLQDRQRERFQLLAERDTLVAEGGRAADRLAEMDKRITTADHALAEAESQVQAAVPKYNKKIQEPVSEEDLRGLLQPDEALLSVFAAPEGSYAFLLQREGTLAYPIMLKQADITALVHQLRESSLPKAVSGQAFLPDYDTKAAYRLYAAVVGPAVKQLQGKLRLTIAANGALRSFPFGALVTEPDVAAPNGDYRKVPFLVRQFALGYVPAPRTFVDLRRIKTGSPGSRPFILNPGVG
jgi:hypothetical protein